MPEPRCLACAIGIPLDTQTYAEYHGPLRCPKCGFTHNISLRGATVEYMGPLVEHDALLLERHTIPEQPLGDYNEAVRCYAVNAWKASAVMARRAIQGALLARGVDDARPQRMIDDARNKHGILSEREHRLASTVTFFGGKGAHPENAGHPTNEEINEVGQIEARNGLAVSKVLLLALFPPAANQVTRPPFPPSGFRLFQ